MIARRLVRLSPGPRGILPPEHEKKLGLMSHVGQYLPIRRLRHVRSAGLMSDVAALRIWANNRLANDAPSRKVVV
jgi:hypothetical protein